MYGLKWGKRGKWLEMQAYIGEANRALERIDKGTYGICANCRQSIQAERFEALPSATLCIDCQRLGAQA